MITPEPNVAKKFNLILILLAIIYFLSGIVCFFFTNYFFYLINLVPNQLKFFEAIPNNNADFWLVFAASNMIMLSVLSFLTARSKNKSSYIFIHLLSKLLSGAGFIFLFVNHVRYFAYFFTGFIEILIAGFLIWSSIRLSIHKRKSAAPKTS